MTQVVLSNSVARSRHRRFLGLGGGTAIFALRFGRSSGLFPRECRFLQLDLSTTGSWLGRSSLSRKRACMYVT